MNKDEVRRILSAYRPDDSSGPPFTEVLQEVDRDPELSRWWAEEQIFDQAIAGKVQAMPVPPELKSRLLQAPSLPLNTLRALPSAHPWVHTITLLAAALAVAAVLFSSWRGPFQPANSLADYRDEMVSFVRLTPSLDLRTNELSQLLSQVQQDGTPGNIALPPRLRELEAIGCRTLRFRGHDVALLCFKRADGRWAHLFVVSHMAFPSLSHIPAQTYGAQGEWMTAAWSEDGHSYLLALQGGQDVLEKYF